MTISRVEDHRPYTHTKPCPSCNAAIEFWTTSGMSMCFPHFYCDRCSNVLFREGDRDIVMPDNTDLAAAHARIAPTLPTCPCGGRFTLEHGPKCPKCGYEFERYGDTHLRMVEPHILLFAGAVLISDR